MKKTMDARVPNIIQSRLVQFTKPFDLEKVMHYDSESGRVKLSQAQYVFYFYQHFEQSNRMNPLMNILYHMGMGSYIGLGQSYFFLSLYIENAMGRLNGNQFDYQDPTALFFKTMANHIGRGISNHGMFIILLNVSKTPKSTSGHRCAILFSKSKHTANTINVYAYDPNGYNIHKKTPTSVCMHTYISSLGVAMLAHTTYTLNFKPESYFGMHFMHKNNPGLCVMFTYLWLYIVLIMKSYGLHIEHVLQIDFQIAQYAASKLNIRITKDDIKNIQVEVSNLLLSIAFNFALNLIDIYLRIVPNHEFITRMRRTTHILQGDVNARKIHLENKSPREKRSPIAPSASPRLKYGQICKKSDECETSYCNRKTYTCDHYPFEHEKEEFEKHNVEEFFAVSLQLYLEYIKSQNLEHVPPPHDLIYDWYSQLPPVVREAYDANFDKYKAMFDEEYSLMFIPKRPKSSSGSGSKRGTKKSKLES